MLTTALIQDRAAVEEIPWRPYGPGRGVRRKILWDTPDGSCSGLLRLDPGAVIAPHSHRRAAHHLLVLNGSCTESGRVLDRGSYAVLPPGVEHAMTAGEDGCTVFFHYTMPEFD